MAKRKPQSPPEPLEQCPRGLPNTKATELEIVRWVARAIDDPHVKPSQCPDPFAWTLLRQCRGDPSFCSSFIEKLWSKLIPSRSQLDQGDTKAVDGQVTMDLIDRITAMRDKATGRQEASEPEAPKVPNAFAEYNPEDDE